MKWCFREQSALVHTEKTAGETGRGLARATARTGTSCAHCSPPRGWDLEEEGGEVVPAEPRRWRGVQGPGTHRCDGSAWRSSPLGHHSQVSRWRHCSPSQSSTARPGSVQGEGGSEAWPCCSPAPHHPCSPHLTSSLFWSPIQTGCTRWW